MDEQTDGQIDRQEKKTKINAALTRLKGATEFQNP